MGEAHLEDADDIVAADGIDMMTLSIMNFQTDASGQGDRRDESDDDQPVFGSNVANYTIASDHTENQEKGSKNGEDNADDNTEGAIGVLLILLEISTV